MIVRCSVIMRSSARRRELFMSGGVKRSQGEAYGRGLQPDPFADSNPQ